jgi:hypothetical protein
MNEGYCLKGLVLEDMIALDQHAFSSVSFPDCTMLSAISTHGILPENDAEVYP